jgi:D-amino-acid dehydrogenase
VTGAGTSVVVIGGGAVGLITAYHLHREGADVTLIDARRTGRGAAEVNAGWICPAESAPVPGPGMISKSLKWMLHRDSPLYIRPEPSLGFLKFMLGMWRSSNGPTQRAGFEAHLRLAQGTIEAYEDYRADGIDFELRHDGLLMAFTDRENLDHHRELLDLAERFDRDPLVLIGDDVRNHEPLLSDRVYGGVFFPKEQHVDPHALMRSLHRRLVQGGVCILEDAPLAGVRTDRDRITEITAGTERLSADAYVLAAGAWTGPLSRLIGAPLPVRPGKGYSIDVDPFPLRSSTNLSDAKVAVTPLTRNLRLAGTMEFGGLDEELNQIRIGAILRGPAVYFRDWTPPAPQRITPRAGIRPMTPDGMPIIGRLGELSNAYVSTGHGMQGITLGPGSALALTALVLKGEVPDVLAPFAPARFTRAVVRKSPQLADAR